MANNMGRQKNLLAANEVRKYATKWVMFFFWSFGGGLIIT
jgi:hypothetical protein